MENFIISMTSWPGRKSLFKDETEITLHPEKLGSRGTQDMPSTATR